MAISGEVAPGIPLKLTELHALTLLEQLRRSGRAQKECFDLCFIPHLLSDAWLEVLASNLSSGKKVKRFQIIIGTSDDRVSSDESHWSAIDVDVHNRSVIAFDARLGGPRDELKSLNTKHPDVLGKSGMLFWKKKGFRLYSVDIGRQVQYDFVSCHVFAYNILKNSSQLPDLHKQVESRWTNVSGQQKDGALNLLSFEHLPFDLVKGAQNMKFFSGVDSKGVEDTSGSIRGSYFDFHREHYGLTAQGVQSYQDKLDKYAEGRANKRINERARRYEQMVAAFFQMLADQDVSADAASAMMKTHFETQLGELKRTGRLSLTDLHTLFGVPLTQFQLLNLFRLHKEEQPTV